MKKKFLKSTAVVLIFSMMGQIVWPSRALALTSGPSQPEVQSFEPVGTTDMVDLFSGDFTYNIPLLDVDGYPVNISYHSGINIEQEASWVGLGWNINPGVATRAVRGVPDDFNGDVVERIVNIKDEKNTKVNIAASVELFGSGVSLNAGMFVNSSNYRGMSVGLSTGAGVSAFGFASAGVNMGISSQGGADIDYSAGLSYSTSNSMSREFSAGIGLNGSGGYNTRSGYKDFNVSVTANYKAQFNNKRISGNGSLFSATIPIGLQSYVPVITNSSHMKGFSASVGVGGEVYGVYLHGQIGLTMSKLSYDSDGSIGAYGYMYLQNAPDHGYNMMDFTRDKDGMFNKTMKNLPTGNMAYDVYSVSAQGTGGLFRAYRNDRGFVYDPKMGTDNKNDCAGLEIGLGNTFEVGLNYSSYDTDVESGPWEKAQRKFIQKENPTRFENVYFRQAGELTENYDPNEQPVELTPGTLGAIKPVKDSTAAMRDPRGNLIYCLLNEEARHPGIAFSSASLENYTDTMGLKHGPSVEKTLIDRKNNTTRKGDKISEVVQVNKDGSRYIYGLPAINNIQNEVSYSTNEGENVIAAQGLVSYSTQEDKKANEAGQEHFYSRSVTPAYAHSYLLTDVLSADFTDVTGDGPSDDDIGTYVKFNYSRKEDDYRWRIPYKSTTSNYNPGFYCDKKDGKANYVVGSKEQWYVHSIETKNFVAEFYTSKRKDAKGAMGKVFSESSMYLTGDYGSEPYSATIDSAGRASSFKLDSIKLYNKHDRFINQDDAVPVKSVYFVYDYSLCEHSPNSVADSGGKLTLKKIYMSYGNSDKNMLSPYQFTYDGAANHDYDLACKDRWGNYKANNPDAPNHEFPYTDQTNTSVNDADAAAWHLTQIQLPSGGLISVQYESDDYAYVQGKKAMEMFKVEGVGASPDYYPNKGSLYADKNSPFLYIYFLRRQSEERNKNLKEVYLNNEDLVYYNFNVDLLRKNMYDAVRGYAEVEDIDSCVNDNRYGWIRIKAKDPQGSSAHASPISYTGINMSRYYLPHLFYPGSDPDEGDLENIMKGMASAAEELFGLFKNPMERFLNKGFSKEYNPDKSVVRLYHPALCKKGGGSRVKQIKINDAWNTMAGADHAANEYGNSYEYKRPGEKISSGVASYEPLIGGDENPLRNPSGYYKATNGTKFPPNDPVELFQEEPIGESMYPPAGVGYSFVKVRNIHVNKARSAQTEDEYEFYTAKDFPIRVKATPISADEEEYHKFLRSKMSMTATQGYSIIMNDMHGKPRSIKNYALLPQNKRELVTGQTFLYYASGNELNNRVSVMKKASTGAYETTATLGQETDVTIDSRQKIETTHVFNLQANLNVFIVGIYPIPIPTAFFPPGNHERSFHSLVCTKVVQKYGILRAVETVKEGAKFVTQNEIFDAETGDVLLTRVNNEFGDPQYSMNYPAWWAHFGMGAAYRNILVEDHVHINNFTAGSTPAQIVTSATSLYEVGDELYASIHFPADGTYPDTTAVYKYWVVAVGGSTLTVQMRGPQIVPPNDVHAGNIPADLKIIRSGLRNQLSMPMQSTVSLDRPIGTGVGNHYVLFNPQKALTNSVTTYSETNVQGTATDSSSNKYVMGTLGNWRVSKEAAYLTNRDYTGPHARKDGWFKIGTGYWSKVVGSDGSHGKPLYEQNPAAIVQGLTMPWKDVRTVNAYDPWGHETENQDALGIPSSAQFGYANSLPVAVASNAKNYEMISESFEDYRMLNLQRWLPFSFSKFKELFQLEAISGLGLYTQYNDASSGDIALSETQSHTGFYSLKIKSDTAVVEFPTAISDPTKLNKFCFNKNKPNRRYIVSCWVNGSHDPAPADLKLPLVQYNGSTQVGAVTFMTAKSNVIDGWRLMEGVVEVNASATKVKLKLPPDFLYDDFRAFPSAGNMKAFVYHPRNQKLIATLDENNFASFYEYDAEGQLIRINKETEKGVLTVQESRRATVKK
jgi:hypothetical protein